MMIESDSFARCCAFGSIVLISASWAPTSAFAQENLRLAGDFGSIIGSAEPCGYVLNEDAVSAYIAAKVPASDVGFADTLRLNISYHRRKTSDLSGLDRRVVCEAAQRSAMSLGLLAAQ